MLRRKCKPHVRVCDSEGLAKCKTELNVSNGLLSHVRSHLEVSFIWSVEFLTRIFHVGNLQPGRFYPAIHVMHDTRWHFNIDEDHFR